MVTTLAASKRLRKELHMLRQAKDEDDDIVLQPNPDNLLLWKAWIRGPADTPYADGVFQLDIRCGYDYPLAPPTMRFVTKVKKTAVQRIYMQNDLCAVNSLFCNMSHALYFLLFFLN
jgi:ubiquitin-protein ligase